MEQEYNIIVQDEQEIAEQQLLKAKNSAFISLLKESVKNRIYKESLNAFLKIEEEMAEEEINSILIPIYEYYLLLNSAIDLNIASQLITYEKENKNFKLPKNIRKELVWLEIEILLNNTEKSNHIKSLIEDFYSENLYETKT